MAGIVLPFEIKRLVFEYLDLPALKSLRLASTSWASVGLELLLLPTFAIKSTAVDVQRLINIGNSPAVSLQAAEVVRQINFYGNDWDPRYLRRIFCSRHCYLQNYEVIDFVPTEVEAEALQELDSIIEQKIADEKHDVDEDALVLALRQVPQVNNIQILLPTSFKNVLLKKVWDEYMLETYRSAHLNQVSSQFIDVLHAATKARLEIQHVNHEMLTSNFFIRDEEMMSPEVFAYFGRLKSLSLAISDVTLLFSSHNRASELLYQLIAAAPNLENLSLKFESLFNTPLDFLPVTSPNKLRSLYLVGVGLDAPKLLSFLETQQETMKYLSLTSIELTEGTDGWKGVLMAIRDRLGSKLEKFQLSGIAKCTEDESKAWLLWPIYKQDWTDAHHVRNRRTKEIENFVLRGAPWPLTDADDVSHLYVL